MCQWSSFDETFLIIILLTLDVSKNYMYQSHTDMYSKVVLLQIVVQSLYYSLSLCDSDEKWRSHK